MRETARKGVFWRIGRSIYRFRWAVAAVWLLLFLTFGLFAQKTPGLLKENGFTPKGSDSDIGLARLQDKLGFSPSSLQLIYTSEQVDVTAENQKAPIMEALSGLEQLPYVTDVSFLKAPRQQQGKKVQTVVVALNLSTDSALEHFPEIKSKVAAPAGMNVYATGGTAVLYDMQVASKKDIAKAELIGLPIALIVLLIVFGTLIGAVLPLVVGLMSVTLTLGIVYFIAQHESLSNFLPNMVTMLGLAVGTDYALFLVSRFREELKRQPSVEEAVGMTAQTAGSSIFFSGIAVLIGLIGMVFIPLTFYRSLCLGGVLVVSISVLVANSLLLSLLSLLGHRINALQVLPAAWRKKGTGSFWEKVSVAVMRRPVALVLFIGAALIYMMTPIGQMKLGIPSAEVLPPSYESRYGSDLLKAAYDPRELNPIQIVAETKDSVWEADSIRQVQAYEERLKRVSGVKSVQSYVDAAAAIGAGGGAGGGSAAGTPRAEQTAALLGQAKVRKAIEGQQLAKERTALLVAVTATGPDDTATDDVVRAIRKLDAGGLQVLVTGGPAYRLDVMDRIQKNEPFVLAFVMCVTYVVLLFAFRSVLLPLKAVLMNVLSLGASLGMVVRVFQYGDLADVLHITSTGYVSATLPVIIFCVVFGISMDYEVFLISRIMEEYAATGDNERSTTVGLKKTGSLITSAAFILIVVVGSFLFTDIEIMKALGLGLAMAVLVDATIVRVALVPALMKLLGKANWWAPRWLRPL